MTQTCRPAKCIEAVRVALLDPCTLLTVPGPLNGYAMGCIIDPSWTPEIEEGEESIVKNDCGEICHRDDRCDQAKRWNLEFKIANPDPEFLSLLMGDPLVVSGGQSIGVRHSSHGCSPYLYVEMFELTDECDSNGDPVYYRHVFPAARLKWTSNEREGIFRVLTIEGKTKPVLTNTIETGAFNDIPVGLIAGGPTEQTDYVWFEDATIPAVQCGSIEVPDDNPPFTCTNLVGDGLSNDSSFRVSGAQIGFPPDPFMIIAQTDVGDFPYEFTFTTPGGGVAQWGGGAIEISDPAIAGAFINTIEFFDVDINSLGVCSFEPPVLVVDDPDPPPSFTGWAEMAVGAIDDPKQIVIDSQDRYLVVGTSNFGGSDKFTVARFTTAGVLDPTFGAGGFARSNYVFGPDEGVGIVVYPDDSMLVLGNGRTVGNQPVVVLTKFTAAGAVDATWNAGNGELSPGAGVAVPRAIFRESNGRIVIATIDPANPNATTVIRTDAAGTVNDNTDVIADFHATTMAKQQQASPNGTYVLAGTNGADTANRAVRHVIGVGGPVTDISAHGFAVPPRAVEQRLFTDGVYLVGEQAGNPDTLRIVRYSGGAWGFDPTFNGGAPQNVSIPAWATVQAADVMPIAGGAEDVLISGWRAPGDIWVGAMITVAGVLQPTYGTAGVAEFIVGDNSDATIVDSVLEEFQLRATHVGVSATVNGNQTIIGRTLLFGTDGLDPAFS